MQYVHATPFSRACEPRLTGINGSPKTETEVSTGSTDETDSGHRCCAATHASRRGRSGSTETTIGKLENRTERRGHCYRAFPQRRRGTGVEPCISVQRSRGHVLDQTGLHNSYPPTRTTVRNNEPQDQRDQRIGKDSKSQTPQAAASQVRRSITRLASISGAISTSYS